MMQNHERLKLWVVMCSRDNRLHNTASYKFLFAFQRHKSADLSITFSSWTPLHRMEVEHLPAVNFLLVKVELLSHTSLRVITPGYGHRFRM